MRKLMMMALLAMGLVIPPAASATPYVSNYWSGYVAITEYPNLATDMTTNVPTLNCKRTRNETQRSIVTGGGNGVAIWTGLDGFRTNTLEQAGVAGACLKGGRPIWHMFTELYPGDPRYGPYVQPGQEVRVRVFAPNPGETPYVYDLKVSTIRGKAEQMESFGPPNRAPNTTAETIVERPGGQKSITAFDRVITTTTTIYPIYPQDEVIPDSDKCGDYMYFWPGPCSTAQKVSLSGSDVGLTRPIAADAGGDPSSAFSASYK